MSILPGVLAIGLFGFVAYLIGRDAQKAIEDAEFPEETPTTIVIKHILEFDKNLTAAERQREIDRYHMQRALDMEILAMYDEGVSGADIMHYYDQVQQRIRVTK